MKCVFNINSKSSSNLKFSCGDQIFDICGEDKSEIAFDIPKPGIYTVKIAQLPTSKTTLFEWLIIFLISIVEIIFDLFTFSWNFSWKQDVIPYYFNAVMKVQMSNDRKISIDIYDSKYKGGWQYPQIKIKNISSENISVEYFLNEIDFKQTITHYVVKLSLIIIPCIVILGLCVISFALNENILSLLFVIVMLIVLIAFYSYQLNKLITGCAQEIKGAKSKLEKMV